MTPTRTIAGVDISRAEKILFPAAEGDSDAVSKADLGQYYEDVAKAMLPHLRGRPVSMKRFPDGIDGESFFEKKVPDYFPAFIERVNVETSTGHQDQLMVNNVETLVYLAGQACITPHTWLATSAHLRLPDQLIFDLDPSAPGTAAVREATTMVGELLDELGLIAYLKTTGSRGYHVMVPIEPERDVDDVRAFARGCAEVLAHRDPELLTIEARKNKRGERVLVDVARNAYAQTAVPPYAARARPGATVATPIAWDELSKTEPNKYTVTSVRNRLAQRPDPWADIGDDRQSLSGAMKKLESLTP